MCRPEHNTREEEVSGDAHSDADFAEDLLWYISCFLQRLVQGAAVLQPTRENNMDMDPQHLIIKNVKSNYSLSLPMWKKQVLSAILILLKELYHVLHADADLSITVESSIEAHDVGGVTLVQHLQLPDDLVPDGWFDLQVDQLEGTCFHI